MGGKGCLFAPGFVDEVILRAGQIHSEFNYLLDNPRRLAIPAKREADDASRCDGDE